VAQLRPHIPAIHAAKAELYVVGSGAPHFVAGFRETTGFEGPVLCDPKLASYQAAGMKRSMMRLADPRGVIDLTRALRAGHRQARVQGDAAQLGGVLVVSPGGALRYSFVAGRPGDLAPSEAVLAALA
jgi:hypothetical protein